MGGNAKRSLGVVFAGMPCPRPREHVFTFSVILSLTISLFCPNLFALNGDMGGGDGSADFPWLIQDLLDFHEFTEDPNYWDDHTRLDCDPNLAGITYTTAVIAPDIDNSNGGYFDGIAYTGVFDGNSHTISNLLINDSGVGNSFLGLFGRIEDPNAGVKCLGLDNVNITGGLNSYSLGGLCGSNKGDIINCYIHGSITGTINLGGLCGVNYFGSIINCYSNSSVNSAPGSYSLGGLCGENYEGNISNSYSTGLVNDGAGRGLCGGNTRGNISNSYF
jgi:GLUG motif-containing protein